MKKHEVDDAIASIWVLVGEVAPIVIGSQSLHGKYPDVADSILRSREVDVILPNKAKLGNWLVDVVGDGTPFEVERGYYIDHVLVRDGLPILAEGWDSRAIRQAFSHNGERKGEVRFLSPEDMAISKLAAGRAKDVEFVHKLLVAGLLRLEDVCSLVPLVDLKYRMRVEDGLRQVTEILPDEKSTDRTQVDSAILHALQIQPESEPVQRGVSERPPKG